MFDITHALSKIGGGTLVDCGGYEPRDESSYPSALVVVERTGPEGKYHPFVVWLAVNSEPDQRPYFVSGDYFDNEKEARDYFERKVAQKRIEFHTRRKADLEKIEREEQERSDCDVEHSHRMETSTSNF